MSTKKTIGDYAVIKQIGQGSLGTVYLAEHRFMKKPFAIKVLPEELSADRGFLQRFEKEVAMLATIDHPHIVKVHQVSFADGLYFIVNDCIVDTVGETTNLAQYLSDKEGGLSEEEILQIATQVASALDHAHPIAHRGLKLNNILIGKGHNGLYVTLSDFGLSRVIGSGAILSRSFKAITELLALKLDDRYTPGPLDMAKFTKLQLSFYQNYAFLAPEQKSIASQKAIDAKADIYAFGVLIYYLIFQEYPEGFFEMPSKKRSDFKLNWDMLLYRCLQADPEKRADSLKNVMEELQGAAQTSARRPILKPQEIVRPEYEQDPGAIFQQEKVVGRYQAEPVENIEVEPVLTEMTVINGGTFYRGSNNGGRDEMPRHAVNLSSFAIDVHPVTNEQFVRFLEAMGGEKDGNNNDIIRLRESRIKRSGGKLNIESGYAKHPVVGVTWYGAIAYAKWVGKRLPTEAEWEIAACGGPEEILYPSGNNIERSQANFFSSDTTAVMSYPPNAYGLFDMAGNVYEWCQDWYGYHYYSASVQEPNSPKGPLQGVYRVLRGGCWKSLKEDLRCAHRHRNNPGTMNGTYGFRCAADVC